METDLLKMNPQVCDENDNFLGAALAFETMAWKLSTGGQGNSNITRDLQGQAVRIYAHYIIGQKSWQYFRWLHNTSNQIIFISHLGLSRPTYSLNCPLPDSRPA